MNRKYLAFDIETAKVQPPDERDWKSDRPLGISCAATLCCDANDRCLVRDDRRSVPHVE